MGKRRVLLTHLTTGYCLLSTSPSMNDEQILKLREILLNEFSEEELAAFTAELGLDYATLPGEGQFGKTREIFLVLREQDRLQALKSRLRALRPAAYEAAGLNLIPPAPENARRLPIPLAWLVLGLVGILVVVCILTFLLRPNGTPATPAATVMPTVDAALETPLPALATEPAISEPITDTSANAVTDTAPAQVEVVPTMVIVATAEATVEAVAAAPTVEPTAAVLPSPSPTPTVSETHPAALAVSEANLQLVPYFQGKADQTSLTFWQGAALQSVVSFSKGALLRRLKITEADRASLASTVTYLSRPTLISQRNDTTFVVDTREYWTYRTGVSNVICETSSYRYTVVKANNAYKVSGSTSTAGGSTCNQ